MRLFYHVFCQNPAISLSVTQPPVQSTALSKRPLFTTHSYLGPPFFLGPTRQRISIIALSLNAITIARLGRKLSSSTTLLHSFLPHASKRLTTKRFTSTCRFAEEVLTATDGGTASLCVLVGGIAVLWVGADSLEDAGCCC
jgi:hypothetical protein